MKYFKATLFAVGLTLICACAVGWAQSSIRNADPDNAVVEVSIDGGHGTGFSIDDTHVVTAGHVVQHAENGNVTIVDRDGHSSIGKVLWSDDATDVALVEIVNGKHLSHLDTACSLPDASVGTFVTSIGYPLHLGRVTTWGRVGARVVPNDKELGGKASQIVDITIGPGNSGGPVFDARNRIVGMVDALAATPMPTEMGVVPNLLEFTVIIPRSSICASLNKPHVPFEANKPSEPTT